MNQGTDINRFRCSLSQTGVCTSYARVTLADADGETARACPQHAVEALFGTARLRVDWPDSRGLNSHEVTALQLAEERSTL